MLPDGECRSDRIRDLTEASLARMMRVTPELAEQLDTARSCAGATSATTIRYKYHTSLCLTIFCSSSDNCSTFSDSLYRT